MLFPKTGTDPLKPQPPLSLLAISPYIEEKGMSPVIVDQRIDQDYPKRIRELLPRALFAGITSMTGGQLKHALELIRMVKRLSPDTPVVFGGIHASLMPEQTLLTEGVDLVVAGEGEPVMSDIIEHYRHGKALPGTKGIFYRKKGKAVSGSMHDLMNLDELKTPSWHLADLDRYTDVTVQGGRGCPYACAFCYNMKYNRRVWRARRPEAIVDELALLYSRYGVKDFHFIDDNFFTDFNRVAEICRLILKRGLDIRWKSSFRADYFRKLTPELAELLKKSGVRLLFVGGESGSPEILEKINKQISVDDIVSAAMVSKKYGLPVSISFMSGFPFEGDRERSMTYDLMDRIRQINPSISIEGANVYTPYPGNDLYEESKKLGFAEPGSLAAWSGFVYNTSNLPWFSKTKKRMIENVSLISRFVFWEKAIKDRFLKGYDYPFYWFFRISAFARWRTRFFRFAFEWDLLRMVIRKARV